MELTRQAIQNHKHVIPGIDGYKLLLSKIEDNVVVNPDISIEACRALIEGLSLKSLSLLSDKYNSSKSFRGNCKQDLRLLTKTAFEDVYSNFVESKVHESLANLVIDVAVSNKIKDKAKYKVKEQAIQTIGKISAIRNERGDISHGRDYPKPVESTVILAKSIKSICDGICSFMIEEIGVQYGAKLKELSKLIYSDLEEFNEWLDKQHRVSSVKVDYSKLLYESAYDKYEEFYYSEYLETKTIEEELEEIQPTDTKFKTQVKPETKEEPEKEIEKLVNTFDEEAFWIDVIIELTEEFAEYENLKIEKLKGLITDFLSSDKKPLRDEVSKAMNEKPPLKERAKTIDTLTEKIITLSNDLKELIEEK